jgi:hypothetical protein
MIATRPFSTRKRGVKYLSETDRMLVENSWGAHTIQGKSFRFAQH